jgi:Flp pilus assembly protein TadG
MKLALPARRLRDHRGQGLIEAAVILPFLFLLLFNAINFAYFFYVGLNLTSAPKDAVEYAVQGPSTPGQLAYPGSSAVKTYLYTNLQNGLTNYSNTPVNVCTSENGLTGTGVNQKAVCFSYTNSGSSSTNTGGTTFADPEAPYFVTFQVDVTYTVQPLIAGSPFGIKLFPVLTLHRQISMRNM